MRTKRETVNTQNHIVTRIREQIRAQGEREAIRFQQQSQWASLSWRQMGERIDQLSRCLLNAGCEIQQTIAIFAPNSEKWAMLDYAALQIRAVPVPIYATSTAQQAAHIINDADVQWVFVGDEQREIAVAALEHCPNVKGVIALSQETTAPTHPKVWDWASWLLQDDRGYQAELEARIDARCMDDLTTLIYTSGTTGDPKGVMLDYANIAAQLEVHDQVLALRPDDVSLAFLPLSHVFERAWSYYVLHRGAVNCYLSNPLQVREALAEVKPTVMCAVPRFYEKIHGAIHDKLSRATGVKPHLFRWALRQGERHAAQLRAGQSLSRRQQWQLALADKLVLSKLRALLGGKMRLMPCGGARLDPDIGAFFHAIGINVKLGYGMTETTATVSCWDDTCFDPQSIGHPMPGAEVRIGADNEIQVRGPMVMRGYFNQPDATAATFTEDGFLKTGDAGYLDTKGSVFITDRIKELMKTSGGKYIAPQRVEGALVRDHFIDQIAVVAEARHFVSALIVPCFDALEEWARAANIEYQNRKELLKHADVVALFEKRLQSLQHELAKFEQVKRFTLLPQGFCMHSGELTPTMKLRRKVILSRYQDHINTMYQR
ncbi:MULTISPECIES: AMP-dependent synthetase/ligase [Salinivibrio]|uniref:Long-chain fatty acid--CoA ligase n=2 Tax=Pseudomonadota TaxID=1224 RepID=A0AB36K7L7_9GAMM|nr:MULTISPECIES: long-chain fatty acid--CoA ligase [Salinivibrio]ODP98423.1 long-chain fatty acid--CoA ligase [Salinivibrio sp. BNH]OOE44524.1 long-chain fatty acid--CoA ligase [Salinivibrio kushneri]